jgi:hypothetical protein
VGWNYNPEALDTDPVMQVRAELQDTDPNDQQLQDEEIAYALAAERNMWAAAARCAEMIGRRVLRKADVHLGRSMQITYSKMADQWFQMARMLRSKSLGTTPPWVGGANLTDQINFATNTDLIQPVFTKTMMENPRVGGYTTDSLIPATGGGDEGVDEEVIEF